MALFDASTTSYSISLNYPVWNSRYLLVPDDPYDQDDPLNAGWSVSAATDTQFIETQQSSSGLQAVWNGSGLSYTRYDPQQPLSGIEALSGTIHSFSLLQADGKAVFQITGFSYQALDLSAYIPGYAFLSAIFAGNDTLISGAGNDSLIGYGGNDSFVAGLGDDTIVSGVGNDTIDGGEGFDTVTYDPYIQGASPVFVKFDEFGVGSATVTDKGTDLLLGIEGVIGTHNADTIQGHATDAVDNFFAGGAGNDTLDGGAGNDSLEGGDGSDKINGGTGNDTIDGGSSGWESLHGGSGTDTLSFASYRYAFGLQFDMATGRFELIHPSDWDPGYGQPIGGTAFGFETVQGSSKMDVLLGNGAANLIDGGGSYDKLGGRAGNDTLQGGWGDDTLDGGAGDDLLIGGTDNDTYVVDSLGDVVQEAADGGYSDTLVTRLDGLTLQQYLENLRLAELDSVRQGTGNAWHNQMVGNSFDNLLSGLDGNDALRGNAGNDTLLGGGGDDVLLGRAGNDLLDGGAGWDTVKFIEANGKVSVDLAAGTAQAADHGVDTLLDIEAVVGSQGYGDSLSGNELDNELFGLGGNDSLIGGGGRDTLWGGEGNDLLRGGAGNDVLYGESGHDTLTGGAGADMFRPGSYATRTTVTDFVSGIDKLAFSRFLGIGDRDQFIEGAQTWDTTGGFSTASELIFFTQDIATPLDANAVASAIGSAASAYTVYDSRLFVVDNGSGTSAIYLFSSRNADATVSAMELRLLAEVHGATGAATTAADYLLV